MSMDSPDLTITKLSPCEGAGGVSKQTSPAVDATASGATLSSDGLAAVLGAEIFPGR
jgi:hypothetical protein